MLQSRSQASLTSQHTHPLIVAAATASTLVVTFGVWFRFARRIPTIDQLRPSDFSPRRLRGQVVRVGDGDNCRLFHRPSLRPFLPVPTKRAALANQTLHVRLAGIDAPELPHFGKAEQPYAREALAFLTKKVLGKRVVVELFKKDQYGRVVGQMYLRPFPFLRRQSVSDMMIEAGYATVYKQAGAVYGKKGVRHFEDLEARARNTRKGMWAQGADFESPAAFKRRTK